MQRSKILNDQVIRRARLAVSKALETFITNPEYLPRPILVGVSGGADSLALLAITGEVASTWGFPVEAVIIDHQLQSDSAEVAARTRHECEKLNLRKVHVLPVQVSPGGSIENQARSARLAALADLAENVNASAVLLGHTASDQVEQVFLGLLRGSGAQAIAGMPRERECFIRPFLGTGLDDLTPIWREDTEHICSLFGLDPWEDPMNRSPEIARARVRYDVLPTIREKLGERVIVNLLRSADLVREDADELQLQAATLLSQVLLPGEHEGSLLELDAEQLSQRSRALSGRVLRDAARQAREQLHEGPVALKSITRAQIVTMQSLLYDYRGQSQVPLPGNIEVRRIKKRLVFSVLEPKLKG